MRSTQITLHNMRRSPALSARIRELAERLETHHPEILNCRVAVAQDMAGSRKARAYHVTVRVRVPGRELVASHEHGDDVYVALRDAFEAMRRQVVQAAEAARGAEIARRAAGVEVPS